MQWKKPRRILAGCCPALLLLFLFAGNGLALKAGEYHIKSAYLEKISRFIQWPDSKRIHDPQKPFVIGIAGSNPFEGALKESYRDRTIRNKPVEIRKVTSTEQIKDCDLLFIASSEKGRLKKYMKACEQFHVLTVGDTTGFAENGVHINFYMESQKIRFAINVDAMKKAGLSADSLLLDYARIVRAKEPRD